MKMLLRNCTLIDGNGGPPIQDAKILVSNERIERISQQAIDLEDVNVDIIDVMGGFVLPGFCSTHVHLGDLWPIPEAANEGVAERTIRAGRNAMDALRCGVTSMRSLGEDSFIDVEWRRAFESGVFAGPTVIASGNSLIAPGGHAHFMKRNMSVRGVEAVRVAVEHLLDHGVDCIKMVTTAGETLDEGTTFGESQFSSEEIRGAVEIAHDSGKFVCTHTGTPDGVRQAVEAGVDCIEHGYVLDSEAIELLVKHEVFLTPTLSVTHNETFYERTNMAHSQRDRFRRIRDRHGKSFRMADEAGVRIACGADNNPVGFCTLSEIELMVECGMTESNAIVAATRTGAQANGLGSDLGIVAEGMKADMVVIEGNPLEDIANIWNTRLVVKSGQVVEPGPTNARDAFWHVLLKRSPAHPHEKVLQLEPQ